MASFADELGEVELGQLLLRSVVHETLIKLVVGGEDKAAIALLLCTKLQEALQSKLPEIDSRPVLQAALEELGQVCDFVRALGASTAVDLAVLDAIMTSKSGARVLMKNAVVQQGYWRNLEGQVRQVQAASAVMIPEIEDAHKKLETMSLQDITDTICRRIPVWKDSLRAGAKHPKLPTVHPTVLTPSEKSSTFPRGPERGPASTSEPCPKQRPTCGHPTATAKICVNFCR